MLFRREPAGGVGDEQLVGFLNELAVPPEARLLRPLPPELERRGVGANLGRVYPVRTSRMACPSRF
jgi:hypothetical protein